MLTPVVVPVEASFPLQTSLTRAKTCLTVFELVERVAIRNVTKEQFLGKDAFCLLSAQSELPLLDLEDEPEKRLWEDEDDNIRPKAGSDVHFLSMEAFRDDDDDDDDVRGEREPKSAPFRPLRLLVPRLLLWLLPEALPRLWQLLERNAREDDECVDEAGMRYDSECSPVNPVNPDTPDTPVLLLLPLPLFSIFAAAAAAPPDPAR